MSICAPGCQGEGELMDGPYDRCLISRDRPERHRPWARKRLIVSRGNVAFQFHGGSRVKSCNTPHSRLFQGNWPPARSWSVPGLVS